MPSNAPKHTPTETLREIESQIRFMADSMPQPVWITRPDGKADFHNNKWYEFTGSTPEEMDEPNAFVNLIHPDDTNEVASSWSKAVTSHQTFAMEYRLYHAPSDAYRWVIAQALPFRDDNGKIVKWFGTCTDIDEQKHTAQLQTFLSSATKTLASTLHYQTMLANITALCVPALADWCTVDLYDEESDTWKQLAVAHHDPKKVKWALELRKNVPIDSSAPTGVPNVVRTGKAEFHPMITDDMLRASIDDPEILDIMLSIGFRSVIIMPIKIRNKSVGALTFVSADSQRYYTQSDYAAAEELASRISLTMTNAELYRKSQEEIKNRRQLEKELRQAKNKLELRVKQRTQELEKTNTGLRKEIEKRRKAEEALSVYSENLARSNRELQDFAYVASHDLQEPLRKIQAFGNLLEEEYAAGLGDGVDYLQRMRGAAARMSTLIEDLLAFSRVTTKARPFVPVNLNEIAEEVVGDLETRIASSGGKVELKSLPTVSADPTQMRQLLQNLISNALKFHRTGVAPHVTVASRKYAGKNPYHRITVKDNGIGFNEKYLDRIFSVFQRLHGRETYEGTGIGLAVCRKIVERHNGTITAKSEKNKGSTFIITLPINDKEEK